MVRAGEQTCWQCGRTATTVDHVPPLAAFTNKAEWEGDLLPACSPCNHGHGMSGRNRNAVKRIGLPTYERRR